jgi:hypothetical protein
VKKVMLSCPTSPNNSATVASHQHTGHKVAVKILNRKKIRYCDGNAMLLSLVTHGTLPADERGVRITRIFFFAKFLLSTVANMHSSTLWLRAHAKIPKLRTYSCRSCSLLHTAQQPFWFRLLWVIATPLQDNAWRCHWAVPSARRGRGVCTGDKPCP